MMLHTDGIHDKNKMIYASNKNTQGVGYGYGGFRDSVDGDSVGIPTGFSVGMGWAWALKFNPHGSPDYDSKLFPENTGA